MARKSRKPAASAPQFEDRIRFNWGYHQGASNQQAGRGTPWQVSTRQHPDQVYVKGFFVGVEDAEAGRYEGNSDAAWEACQVAA